MKWEYFFDDYSNYLSIKRKGLEERITINILDYRSIWNIEDIKKFLLNKYIFKYKEKIKLLEMKELRIKKLKELKLIRVK